MKKGAKDEGKKNNEVKQESESEKQERERARKGQTVEDVIVVNDRANDVRVASHRKHEFFVIIATIFFL